MKTKGIFLIIFGALGIIFVCTYDIIVGKPVNDISGPKSISALVVCGVLILIGICLSLRGRRV